MEGAECQAEVFENREKDKKCQGRRQTVEARLGILSLVAETRHAGHAEGVPHDQGDEWAAEKKRKAASSVSQTPDSDPTPGTDGQESRG